MQRPHLIKSRQATHSPSAHFSSLAFQLGSAAILASKEPCQSEEALGQYAGEISSEWTLLVSSVQVHPKRPFSKLPPPFRNAYLPI